MHTHILKLILSTILLAGLCTSAMAELPQISNARVVQPPPGAKVAAAYFTVHNNSSEVLQITGAASDAAKQVELHLSLIENDVAMMQQQESIAVDPGQTVDFTHGSYHVMLMDLQQPLQTGGSLNMVLSTSVGDIAITIPVISLDEAMSTHEHTGEKNH